MTKTFNFALKINVGGREGDTCEVQVLQVFANSCELNPTLAILPVLCILMRLPDGDSPCCTRLNSQTCFFKEIQA